MIGQYFYDGSGARVKKVTNTETTVFVYDAGGALAAEYSTEIASVEDAKTSYLTTDHLGSPRVITDADGEVIARRDFMPFGEELYAGVGGRTSGQGYGGDDEVRQKFTGYERDDESGLDYAQARYFKPNHGRFTSVDPLAASANIKNPQTLNRYTYALNSPYKFTDPLGLSPCGVSGGPGNAPGRTCTQADDLSQTDFNRALLRRTFDRASQGYLDDSGGMTQSMFTVHRTISPVLNEQGSSISVTSGSKPRFDTLWSFHKGKKPTYVDPKTNEAPMNFEHQCAINMAYALQMAGVDMSSYKGKTVTTVINGRKMHLATNVYELARWVQGWYGGGTTTWFNPWSRASGEWKPTEDSSLVENIKGRKGIVITVDHWYNEYGQLRGHIDLWNGETMRRAGSDSANYVNTSKYFVFLPLD